MKKYSITFTLVYLIFAPFNSGEPTKQSEATVEENEYEQEDEQGGYEESSTREFVETHNKVVKCDTHEVCYDYREPQTWCKLEEHQQWTDKGCFCDEKLKSCIIERKSGNKLQYANCAPSHNWDCADDDDNDD